MSPPPPPPGRARLECPPVSYGFYGQDVQIRCSVKGVSSRVNVFRVEWKRVRPGAPVSAVSVFGVGGGNGRRFESGWDRSGMEVWLQVKSLQLADEGHYTCLVFTDRGSVVRGTSLKLAGEFFISYFCVTKIS